MALSIKAGKGRTLYLLSGTVASFLIGFMLPHHAVYGDPWGIDVAFVASAFMLSGVFVNRVIGLMKNKKKQIAVLFADFVVFAVCINYSTSSTGYVLMANADYGNPLLFIVNALSGSLFVILLCSLLTNARKTRLIQWIGARTMGIFLVHKPIANTVRTISIHLNLSYDNLGVLFVITIVTLAISCAIVLMIECVLPEIIGLN